MKLRRIWILGAYATLSCAPEPPEGPKGGFVTKGGVDQVPEVGKPPAPIAVTSKPSVAFSKTWRSTNRDGTVTIQWAKEEQADGYVVFLNRLSDPIFLPVDGTDYGEGMHGTDEFVCDTQKADVTKCEIKRKRDMNGNEKADLPGRYFFAVYSYKKAKDNFGKELKKYSQSALKLQGFTCEGLHNKSGVWVHVPMMEEIRAVYNQIDFCVHMFPASIINGVPASLNMAENDQASLLPTTDVTLTASSESCNSLNSPRMAGYHLMRNDEWMTVATLATTVKENWTGGSVGAGKLPRGHHLGSASTSDDKVCPHPNSADTEEEWLAPGCKGAKQSDTKEARRTIRLPNGGKIWDMAGNLWQWVDLSSGSPKDTGPGWHELKVTDSNLMIPKGITTWPAEGWTSDAQAMGRFRHGGGKLARGGGFNDGPSAGIFAADFYYDDNSLDSSPERRKEAIGFRCSWTPP